jgi:serine/threonine-protein kinase
MTLAVGQTIGPYRVIEQVGRGGMATVYKAHQAALARYVALKVLPAFLAEDEGFTERFRSEAVTVAKLRHPNILQVFDYGEENGVHYIVTEFVDGGTLADQIGSPLPPDYVVKMLGPVASALDYAHARDVVHRDVKPSNILLAGDGTPVLSDFGLAKMLMSSVPRLTRTGAVVGTPEYMAPEQAIGEEAGAPADRYALAVIAYEMLLGSVPFSSDTPLATLLAQAHRPLPLPRAKDPKFSGALEEVLLKGLAKDPGDRYATARELVSALEGAQSTAAASLSAVAVDASPAGAAVAPIVTAVPTAATREASAPGEPVGGTPRRGLLAGAVAAVIVLAAAGVAVATGILGGAPASPRPATASGVAPPLLEQLKGPLAWEASFLQDLGTPPPLASGARPTAVAKARADGVDFTSTGAFAPLVIRHAVPAKYVAELDLVAEAGTDANFTYTPRMFGQQGYQVTVDVANELIRFQHTDFGTQPPRTTLLTPSAIPAAGIARGQLLRLAVAVDGTHYRVFAGGALVVDVTDARVNVTDSPTTNVIMGASVNKGTLSVNALKVYALVDLRSEASLLTLLKGALAYTAAFPQDLGTPPPLSSGAKPTAKVTPRGDVVDILPAGELAPILLRRAIPSRYVAEFDVGCDPATDGAFTWNLRASANGQLAVALVLDAPNELLRLQLRESAATPSTPARLTPLLPSAIATAGLLKGRVLHLAVAVDGTRYRVFLDGDIVADVTETRVPVPDAAQSNLVFGGALTRGAFTFSKLRVYELRAPPTPSTP